MTIIASNPLDVLTQHIETFKSQFEGDISDCFLIEKYLLMPLFDIDTPHELELSDEKRDRLYNILRANCEAFSNMLKRVGYDCFFSEVEAFQDGDASYRSRYRPHVIGDDTKQAKATARCMEYLTELFCPTHKKKLPCYNLVVLIATFGNTKYEIPLDIRLWLPKKHPEHKSKPQMMKAMIQDLKEEAQKRCLSLLGVLFSCDAAYQRSNDLMKAVLDASFTIVAKVSGNLNFFINGKKKKAKDVRDLLPLAKMKQSSRLGWRYHYKRILAEHPTRGRERASIGLLGTVILCEYTNDEASYGKRMV